MTAVQIGWRGSALVAAGVIVSGLSFSIVLLWSVPMAAIVASAVVVPVAVVTGLAMRLAIRLRTVEDLVIGPQVAEISLVGRRAHNVSPDDVRSIRSKPAPDLGKDVWRLFITWKSPRGMLGWTRSVYILDPDQLARLESFLGPSMKTVGNAG